MRSFREIVFRADLDGREASLVRAMGIEVVRYLQRVGAPLAATRRPPGTRPRTFRRERDADTLERLLGGQPLRRRGQRAGRGGAAQGPAGRGRGALPRAARRACTALGGVAEAVRYMGAELALGVGIRRGQPEALLGARRSATRSRPPSP